MDKNKIRVLVVEDNPVDARLIKRMLDSTRSGSPVGNFEPAHVDTIAAAVDHLVRGDLDVVLLDLSLPDAHGIESVVKVQTAAPNLPILVLTSSDDEDLALKTVKEGAQDYLIKGQFDGPLLLRSIGYAIERKRMTEELRRSEARNYALLNAIPDLIFRFKSSGSCIDFKLGRGFDAISQARNLIGRNLFSLVPPEVAEQGRRQVDLALKTREVQMMEYRVNRNGHVQDYEARIIVSGEDEVLSIVRDITERKRVDEQLKQALQWQEAIFEGSRDAIFISDCMARFVFVNKAACELTGYSRDELLRMQIPDLHEDVDLDAYLTYHERIMMGEEIVSQAKVLRKDGSKVDVEFNNTSITVSNTAYMHTIARDVTERIRAEKALRDSEARFQLVARATSDVIWDWDVQADRVWWNENVTALFGYSPGDLERGMDAWASYIHPDDRQRILEGVDRIIRNGGNHWSGEYRYRRSDGSFAPVIDRGYVVYDQDHKPVRMLGSMMDITERKRAEEALRESEEKYRTILENIEDAYYEVDLHGNLVFFNESLVRILGYTPDELVGLNYRAYVSEEQTRRVYDSLDSVYKTGEPVKGFAYEIVRKDGGKRFLDCSVSVIKDRNGVPTGFRGIIRDITERRMVEKALQKSEERYRNLFENAPVGIYRTSPDGKILMVNPRLIEMLGYSSYEELASRDLEREGFEPNYPRERFKETLERSGEVRGLEAAWTRHDGSVLWVRENARAMRGPDGSIRFYEGTVEDITERKLAEQALRESEERFRLLIENSSDIITVLNLDGTVRYLSPSSERLLGYAPEERIGARPIEYIHPQDVNLIEHTVSEIVENPRTSRLVEYRYRHRNGSWRILETTAKAIIHESGITGIAAYSRDVTERKAAEEELKEFAAKLERSNRELQEFAYIASHDLQEPLRKVLTFGDRLKARSAAVLESDAAKYLDRMVNAAGRMQTLINDLLALSRVTTKARPFVPVSLQAIASEVLSDLEITIEQVGGRVDVGELPVIDADPVQMHQLLQNLISNALKFHRGDVSPVVTVNASLSISEERTAGGSQNGQVCEIVVEDNGIGFDEKHLDRIFTIFQRLHGRGEYEGTGIGLAICRKIVDRHSGTITAKSIPGKGAAFIVTLPVKQPRGESLQW